MCGICGFTGQIEQREEVLGKMLDKIRHRGPDGMDTLLYEDAALGFCRLSIIDLESGMQPIRNETGDMALVFNGEIYNYRELTEELKEAGHIFRTHSDSETILHAYEQYGSSVTDHLRGMYAFVIWDEANHRLFAARDPFGIKPLYYTVIDRSLVFASEIKSILEFPLFRKRLNYQALEQYLSFQYSVLPETFFRGVYRLLPGHTLIWEKNALRTEQFFDPMIRPQNLADDTFVHRLDRALRNSIDAHMISDVEVGTFLSGGVDSGLIAALFSGQKAYSVGFSAAQNPSGQKEGKSRAGTALYDESALARKLAEESKLDFHQKDISAQEFWDAVPGVMYYLDEPSGDASAIALYFVAREAAKDVKVVLSGEGADELFGGYPIYHEPQGLRPIMILPKPLRVLLGKAASFLPYGMKGRGYLIRASRDVEERFIGDAYIFTEKERRALLKEPTGAQAPAALLKEDYARVRKLDDTAKMQYIDMKYWLPGDILQKADRMSMANSLEVRVPYLDRETWKIAARLPLRARIRGKQTKYIFRRVAGAYLNESRTSRPKLGFPVPIRVWLRQETWYQKVLEMFTSNEARKFFHVEQLFQLMEEHWSGKRDNSRKIWTVYTFLVWCREYGMGE